MIGQSLDSQLSMDLAKKKELEEQIEFFENKINDLQLTKIIQDLKAIGLPSDAYIEHSAMILEYAEAHEQAAWVAHMILPSIKQGVESRTNDFREDPKVQSGTAIEQDYFLTDSKSDGSKEYFGFGYDRGHLAPSADFRWNKKALSESYFYSNMSPQLPEFNRQIWAELEMALREYVVNNDVPLYVMTLPLLEDDLPKIPKAINHLTIPKFYLKVALDIENEHGIAFILPNSKEHDLLPSYAISIDKAEEITSYDFFSNYSNDEVENTFDKERWFLDLAAGDKEPIPMAVLKKKRYFNTLSAAKFAGNGREYTVCGNVVSSRYSKKGHLWLTLDKRFPNDIFSVFIRKENLVHFSGDLISSVENENVCFEGEIKKFSKKPSLSIESEEKMHFFEGY